MSGPIRLTMSMSLDGFVSGVDDKVGQGLGENGFRLFNWLDEREGTGPDGEVYAGSLATRAVVSGRRTWELAGGWGGDHHDGVPIHVLSRSPAPDDVAEGTTFHTDAAACAAAAREAAGDDVVMMHGASAAQAFLAAGELDELEIHLVPVLLGDGRRLFDITGGPRTELELVRRVEGSDAIHLLYRVLS